MGLRLAVLGVAVVLLPVAPGFAAPGCAAQTSSRTGPVGTWTTYAAPTFAAEPKQVTAAAVDPLDGRRWWVTNGLVVLRSLDGGCTWRQTFELPGVPTERVPAKRSTDRIQALTVPPTADGHESVLAAVEVNAVFRGFGVTGEEDAGSTSSTIVLRGADGLEALAPLAVPLGAPGPLVVAPSDGTIFATAGGVAQASADGGRSWRVASPQPATDDVRAGTTGVSVLFRGDVVPRVTRLVVDPLDARSVWVRASGRIYRSDDGGGTYSTVLTAQDRSTLPVLEVTRRPGRPPRVVIGDQADDQAPLRSLRIAEDGRRFVTRRTTAADLGVVTGSVTSSASGPGSALVLTTAEPSGVGSQVYAYVEPAQRLVSIDQFRLSPLSDVQRTVLGSRAAFVFRAPGRLVVWRPPGGVGLRATRPPLPPLPPLPEFAVSKDSRLRPLSDATRVLAPASVRVGVGQSVDVPMTLKLASEPTPLDVFFLLDTSGSMSDVINGLAADFAEVGRDLEAAGIDVQFGLGDYQDTGGVRYRRLVDISPPSETLRRALQSIRTGGGAEPAYTALHQMSTGSGVLSPTRGQAVRPGQGATWRPGSLRVVVHATDEVPSRDEAGADRDEATQAMIADGTRHVGIEVVRDAVRQISDSNAVPDGQLNAILKGMSRDTGGVAPDEEGIDCDADGDIDVPAGAPLVCELVPLAGRSRLALAEPLRRVLSALVDLQQATIAVGPADRARQVQARLAEPARTVVDVKREHVLEHSLRVTCTRELAGTTRSLQLRPQVGVRVGRVTPLAVVCEPPGVVPPPPAAPVIPPEVVVAAPAAVAAVAPALPPPAPVPAPAPAPAPAQAPAPAPAGAPAAAVVVNPGLAVALAPEQEELQLAYVEQEVESELAMSRRADTDLVALRLLAMTVICGTATAVAVRRRDAVAVRRAR